MENEFTNGYAFILEGATEKEFYMALLEHFCHKYSAEMSRIINEDNPDIVYRLKKDDTISLLKFNVVNSVTQMPRAGKWFNTQCVAKYGTGHNWFVFLCYDKDDYKEDISKFFEGDWAVLRQSLKKATQIIDVAAAADIEDVMLGDVCGICTFLSCAQPISIKGSKGKAKMKSLFRENGRTYHAGSRARMLIDSLDMEKLIAKNLIPLEKIENIIFR